MDDLCARYRHKKRGGVYDVVSHATLQTGKPIQDGCDLVIYQAEDGKWWARPTTEFHDGRFEAVPEPKHDARCWDLHGPSVPCIIR